MNNPHILQRILCRHRERTQCGVYLYTYTLTFNIDARPVFLNRRATARYWALAPNITGRERFSWNLSFYCSKHFFINKYFIVEIF